MRQVLVVYGHDGIANQMALELRDSGVSAIIASTIRDAERELVESTINSVIIAEDIEGNGDGFALALRARDEFKLDAEDIIVIAKTARCYGQSVDEGFVPKNNHRAAVRKVVGQAA